MIHQRKRFNYLGIHQRALNTINGAENQKQVKAGCIVSSNQKNSAKKQMTITSQYQHRPHSRQSSKLKNHQPLSQIDSNLQSLDLKASEKRQFLSSGKENISKRLQCSENQQNQKQNEQVSKRKQSYDQLQQKIRYLEQKNILIVKQTENKFQIMQQNLQKVESILMEKQSTIKRLTQQIQKLKSEKQQSELEIIGKESEITLLKEQKQELFKVIGQENKEISKLNHQISLFTDKQKEFIHKIDKLIVENETLTTFKPTAQLKEVDIQTQTVTQDNQEEIAPSLQIQISTQTSQQQTDPFGHQIQQSHSPITLFNSQQYQKNNQLQESLIDIKTKYDSLVKKALQMEEQLFMLKQHLFDSQSETKTIKKQFSTYKLLYQIQKMALRTQQIDLKQD